MNQNITNKRLYIFNLATDLDHHILAFTHDWIESFSKLSPQIIVVSTHVGRYKLPLNVSVRELGGGGPIKRIVGLSRLFLVLFELMIYRKKSLVFHHMSTRTSMLIGFPIRLLHIKQGLWYSHSHRPISLLFSVRFVNVVFSSMPSALPIKTSKSKFVGHGINIEKFRTETNRSALIKGEIISIGRIAPIKNLEKIIKAISLSGNAKQGITLIGATDQPSPYRILLESEAITQGVKIIFKNAMPYSEIPNQLLNYGIFYTGNPRTTDKAAIEAAVTGCFVVSEEQDTLHLVGMEEVLLGKRSTRIPLEEQLSWINSLSPEQDEKYRKIISLSAMAQNDVNNTTRKILLGIINA